MFATEESTSTGQERPQNCCQQKAQAGSQEEQTWQSKERSNKMRATEFVNENFADGKKKGKSRPGRVKKSGASCKGSVTSLRAKAKKASGERARMYHWCANMKSGRKKSKS